jgi:Fe-S cluster biogenesis protein NfuA
MQITLMPDTESSPDIDALHEQVAAVIERIRPAIQDDGGDVELVCITDDQIAQIRLHGACVGCPSSTMTLQMGIERNVCEKVPEIRGVEQID